MNIYNLQQFRCGCCQNWFHPRYAQPYQLSCGHSACRRCIASTSSISIYCPHHQSHTLVSKLLLNDQIQKALERLMKSTSEIEEKPRKLSPSAFVQKLQELVKEKQEDMQAFAQLLERIYTNQINRIIHLRNRVKQEVIGHAEAVKYWKILIQNSKNPLQLIEEGQNIEKRIIEFNKLKLEQMAQQVIADSAAILLPHFTINDLCKIERKTTLKSSAKKQHQRYQSDSRLMTSNFQKQNDNLPNYMVRTVESPDKSQLRQIKNFNNHCKQLSSFKLDSSLKKSIPEGKLKNSKFVQQFRLSNSLFQGDQNGEITLRQNQHSKCSLKTKACQKRQQNRSHFAELINSLKLSDELKYSSQKSQQLLLSSTKPEINFLQQCPIQKKPNRGGLQIRQREIINCERENNKYIKRMEGAKTEQAQMSTTIANNTLQLFNFDLKEVDMKAYLEKFDWTTLQAIKLVGTGMQDAQFNILLNYLINSKIHTLILPNNELQQISLDALVNFTSVNNKLRTISLQRNNIHPLQGNTRSKIAMLLKRGLTLYI